MFSSKFNISYIITSSGKFYWIFADEKRKKHKKPVFLLKKTMPEQLIVQFVRIKNTYRLVNTKKKAA